jgi:hypothetical protein
MRTEHSYQAMRHYTKKFTPEQLEFFGKLLFLIQQLFDEANAQALADALGTKPQNLQYHANKNKKKGVK